MDGQFAWGLVLATGLACASGYLLTWLARFVAPWLGFLDKPDQGRKRHSQPMPLLGGAAVFLGVLLCGLMIGPWLGGDDFDLWKAQRICLSGGLFCLLGLIDDRVALRPRTKFLGQLLAGLPFAVGTQPIDAIEFLGCEFHLGIFGTVFVLFWLATCANIVNLIDGLDGLASTIGAVAMLTIASLSLLAGNVTMLTLSLIVAGSILGFLIHNWPPARIFLGDAGSLTVGFLAGALALEASLKTATVFTLTVPVVVMSVPAFDTLMAILRRRLNGRRIGEGDRGHIHHRLQDRGMTKLQTLLAIGALSLVMAAIAILATLFKNDLIAAVGCLSVLALVIASRLFGYHETSLVFWHVQAFQALLVDNVGHMGTRFLLARAQVGDETQRQQLWHAACQRLSRMGLTSVELTGRMTTDQGGSVQRRWEGETPVGECLSKWSLRYDVAREDGWLLSMTGHGLITSEDRLARADELLRIFQAICFHFSCDDVETGSAVLRFDESHGFQPRQAPVLKAVPSDKKRMDRAA